jgi:hypothetical protein
MPQEVIDRMSQLGKADAQPELLTFFDRKGHSIGNSETSGVPDTLETALPDDDGLDNLNPPTVNYKYGADKEQDIHPPLVKDAQQACDPAPDDLIATEDPHPQVKLDLPRATSGITFNPRST